MGYTPGQNLLAHTFFGTCGVRWAAYRRDKDRSAVQCVKVTTVAGQGGTSFERFSESRHTLEIPLADLQRICLVLTGRLSECQARIAHKGSPVKSLQMRYQPTQKQPFFISLSVGDATHATPFDGADAWHMLIVIRRVLAELYPSEDPSALLDLFLRVGISATPSVGSGRQR